MRLLGCSALPLLIWLAASCFTSTSKPLLSGDELSPINAAETDSELLDTADFLNAIP